MPFLPNNMRPTDSLSAPPPIKISTSAGERLSVIMENSTSQTPAPRRTSWSTFSTLIGPRGYSQSISDASGTGYDFIMYAEKTNVSNKRCGWNYFLRKGGLKRLAVIIALAFIVLTAVVVGLTLGVMKQDSNSARNSQLAEAAGGSSSDSNSGSSLTSTASPTTTAISKSFPAGTYSLVSYLDTVETECVSNPNTWTCFPYTTYNSDQSKAMTTFEWIISAGSLKGTYQISSTDNPFAIEFKNVPLSMQDEGLGTERYQFQVIIDKTVVPTVALMADNAASTCFFNSTKFIGYLYTKKAKDYPTSAQSAPNNAYPLWPFAARAELTIGGGKNVPNCYTNSGARTTQNIASMDPTTQCSCLYKNWVGSG